MNHPSDYMLNYNQESSSDSSHTSVKQQTKSMFIRPPINKPPSQSFHHPNKSKPNAKPAKISKISKEPQKKTKKGKSTKEKNRSVSDYLILGDSFYSCKDVVGVSHRLIEQKSHRIMKEDRVKRKQKKCISKIQKYFKTFVQYLNKKQKVLSNINYQQKVKLYQMLKQQQTQSHRDSSCNTQQLMRTVIVSLEQKAVKLQELYPEQEQVVAKWKNFKLHQLMTAKMFIMKEEHSFQEDQFINYDQQLDILEQQQFFPELKEEAHELQATILQHIRQEEEGAILQIHQVRDYDKGIKWVLDRLLSYIQQRQQWQQNILDKMSCFRQSQMLQGPFLTDQLYIQFQKDFILPSLSADQSNEIDNESTSHIHIFNKAVFDLVNERGPILLFQLQQISVQAIGWLFSRLMVKQQQQLQEWSQDLLIESDRMIFDNLLEQALWEFLDLF